MKGMSKLLVEASRRRKIKEESIRRNLTKFSTLEAAADALKDPTSNLVRVEGRTLPKGYQWNGLDMPGMGKAAARRLRQIEKEKIRTQCVEEAPLTVSSPEIKEP